MGNEIYNPDEWEVIQDTKKYNPSEWEVVSSRPRTKAEYLLPAGLTKYQEKPGERTFLGDVFEKPGSAARAVLLGKKEREQWLPEDIAQANALQRYIKGSMRPELIPTFQQTQLEKRASRPYTSDKPTTMWQELPGMIGASAKGMAMDMATNPGMLLSMLVGKAPLGQGRTLGGVTMQQKPVQALSRFMTKERQSPVQLGKVLKSDYIKTELLPKAQQAVKININKFTPGIEKFAREKLKISQSAINTIKSKGVNAINKVRDLYDNNIDNIYQKITNGVENKRIAANKYYKNVLNNFKEKQIYAQDFYNTLRTDLQEKGWINFKGEPTLRYKQGLGVSDRLNDQLTNMFIDVKNHGKLISKSDFSRFRDNLTGMGWDNPAVQQARKALYRSAEKSGMSGIQYARQLEKSAFEIENLATKGLLSEKNLARFHNLTKEQIRVLKQIESYTQDPFVDDLSSLTAGIELDKIYRITEDIPGQGSMLASELQKATSPKDFNFIKKNLEPFLGNFTESIFKDLAAHRFATGVKTAGKWGAGAIGAGLGYSLLRKPVIKAIENIAPGGE